MNDAPLFLASILVIYILGSRLVMRFLRGSPREVMMALLNLAGVCLVLYNKGHTYMIFMASIGIVVFQFGTLRLFAGFNKTGLFWLAFFCPIGILILIRYLPAPAWEPLLIVVHKLTRHNIAVPQVIGISYLAFRCSRLVLEVRNGAGEKAGLWEYLSILHFFCPLCPSAPSTLTPTSGAALMRRPGKCLLAGPLAQSWSARSSTSFWAAICDQLAYRNLLLNGHPHHWIDLPVAMLFLLLLPLLQFFRVLRHGHWRGGIDRHSGAGEFQQPLRGAQCQGFLEPLAHHAFPMDARYRFCARSPNSWCGMMGPAKANHAIALTIVVVFLLIGIWHGVGWNYVIFRPACKPSAWSPTITTPLA